MYIYIYMCIDRLQCAHTLIFTEILKLFHIPQCVIKPSAKIITWQAIWLIKSSYLSSNWLISFDTECSNKFNCNCSDNKYLLLLLLSLVVVINSLLCRPVWPRRRWVDNIRTDLQEVGCEYMDGIGLAQDRDRWRMLVSAVKNLRVPWNAGNFLTSCKLVSFSRRTLHHGVSK